MLLAVCCVVGTQAQATGTSADYWVFGLGRQYCDSFQQAREQGGYADIAYKNWISGYLTAMNRRSTMDPGFTVSKPFAEVLGWLENYCASHPQQPLFLALEALTASFSADE